MGGRLKRLTTCQGSPHETTSLLWERWGWDIRHKTGKKQKHLQILIKALKWFRWAEREGSVQAFCEKKKGSCSPSVDCMRRVDAVIRQFSICSVHYFPWPVPGEDKQRWLGESDALSAVDRLSLSRGGRTCDRCCSPGEFWSWSLWRGGKEGGERRKEGKVMCKRKRGDLWRV